jgi:dihydroneopterin aldolase
VAQGVADALLRRFAIDEARVRIRKFRSPAPGVPGTTWIEVVRRRHEACLDRSQRSKFA